MNFILPLKSIPIPFLMGTAAQSEGWEVDLHSRIITPQKLGMYFNLPYWLSLCMIYARILLKKGQTQLKYLV